MFLERLLNTIGVLPYLRRRWRDDQQRSSDKVEARFDRHMATVAARFERLDKRLDDLPRAPADTGERLRVLEQGLKALTRKAYRLEVALRFNAEHRERRHGAHVFDEGRLAEHVAAAMDRTRLDCDPMAHVVVDGLLPPETYDALVDAIPPASFFSDADTSKQNFKVNAKDLAPEWTLTALGFLEDVVIPAMIVPALMRMFEAHILATYVRKYGETLGAHVAALTHIATAGRLMLRRPGYHLDPHLDPDRVVVTCLIYFARPGDDEAYGTSFYRIDGNPVIDRRNTFFPESQGHRCDLVKTAPFRPNSAVAFLNAGGAHGAGIPKSAPEGTERYAYQFYVSPEPTALAALIPSTSGSVE
jgi:hypothetical protein